MEGHAYPVARPSLWHHAAPFTACLDLPAGAITKGSQNQYLDKLQVERERGITVKVGHCCLPMQNPSSVDFALWDASSVPTVGQLGAAA